MCECKKCSYWNLRYKMKDGRIKKMPLIQWWNAPGWAQEKMLDEAIAQLTERKG